MANKDGLEPGKSVDFETLQRVKRQHREAAKKPNPAPETEEKEEQPKRGRPAKKTATEG